MCRRNHLRCCLLLGLGIGLVLGYSVDSWIICTFGGIGLVLLALITVNQK